MSIAAPPNGGSDQSAGSIADGQAAIGADGRIVRVLTFGSGAFDTSMQLGVIHALLVIQGKAPDAVVGLSAGSINAVALAEVLQSGEEVEGAVARRGVSPGAPARTWSQLSPAERTHLQQRRIEARARRFREVLERLFEAPKQLIDDLLPDAYQFDTGTPLKPVEAPIFLADERARREEAVANRNGLARLYNQLLTLRLTFGNLTRAVRRGLGLSAAAEIRSRWGRFVVRFVELARIWLLVGANLGPLSRLIPLLGRAALRSMVPRYVSLPKWLRDWLDQPTRGYTAGGLIFRVRALEVTGSAIWASTWFLVLLLVWVGVSLAFVFTPWAVAATFALSPGFVYSLTLSLMAFFAVLLWPSLHVFDRTTPGRLGADVLKGLLLMASLVAFWVIACLLAWTALDATRMSIGETSWLESWAVTFARAPDRLRLVAQGGAWVGAVLVALVAWFLTGSDPGAVDRNGRVFLRSLLKNYRIRRSIFSSYALERFFVMLFDRSYWGVRDLKEVVDESLRDRVAPLKSKSRSGEASSDRKPLSYYSEAVRHEPIHVGIAAADLVHGKLHIVPGSVSVVSGLLAANAAVPLFPPKRLCGRWYVDGANVSSEPMQAVLQLLRERVTADIRVAHVYAVTPLPISKDELPVEGRCESLAAVAYRALGLQKFRDATLERRLTELFTQVIPRGDGVLKFQDEAGKGRRAFRIWVTPVEPDRPVELNRRVVRAPREEARQLVLETIADGCRSALEAMIGPSLPELHGAKRCREAVKGHLEKRRGEVLSRVGEDLLGEAIAVGVPGGDSSKGPGLGIVCSHCALGRGTSRQLDNRLDFADQPDQRGLPWPHERETQDPIGSDGDLHFDAGRASRTLKAAKALTELADRPEGLDVDVAAPWPRPRFGHDEPSPIEERAVRTILFSGGVFRGVFQMGVLTALSNLRIRPDVLAGASVGSITSGMTASVFAKDEGDRPRRVAELAAVYLALDRLVLTDRFADFIRNVTVRAAGAEFSLRQADRVFRRYDAPSARAFEKDARAVFAGLERLLYMSPFEVLDLVQAVRHRDRAGISRQLRAHAREWLERMDVRDELLGADALQLLIEEFILPIVPKETWRYGDGPSFDDLRDRHGFQFLATTTNLTRGKLEILGSEPRTSWGPGGPALLNGLLASSAFPAVFRPRETHEVFPQWQDTDQYVDGGLIDNLPLDAVAEFLMGASQGNRPLVARRPKVGEESIPHLVFSASLEVEMRPELDADIDDLSWPEIMQRTRQLGYNRKLDSYSEAQSVLRSIYASRPNGALVPLDLEVVVVTPNWLCGTFAFHPMLGYRRRRQAQSIAHGCAATMVRFGLTKRQKPAWIAGWDIDAQKVPDAATLNEAFAGRKRASVDPAGTCWLSPTTVCPFSDAATSAAGLPQGTRHELEKIFVLCHHRKTHGVRGAS